MKELKETGQIHLTLLSMGGMGEGDWQIGLVWMAVLAAGVKTVKMGADTVLAVADVVPALRLKTTGSVARARQGCHAAAFASAILLLLCWF